jgi:hypothetical protein
MLAGSSRTASNALFSRCLANNGDGQRDHVQSLARQAHKTRKAFTPAGAVTGIGSLPLTSTSAAIQAVAQFSPEVPFWPQLPQRSDSEKAISQGLGCLADLIEPRHEGYGFVVKAGQIDRVLEKLHGGSGALREENAAGFSAFEEALSSKIFTSAAAVKGQIEGPITLSTYLFHRDKPFLSDSTLFAAIAFHVSQMISWQIDHLQLAGLPVLLFVDEPALCLDALPHIVSEDERLNALAATLEVARTRGAYAGLHCCAAGPFERMFRAKPDILSFDADEGLNKFFANWHALDFVQQGGIVAYGLIPTRSGLDAADSASTFIRWLKAASLAGDPQKFAQRAMITATCGLGLLDESSMEDSFRVAQSVSKLVKTLAGAETAGDFSE